GRLRRPDMTRSAALTAAVLLLAAGPAHAADPPRPVRVIVLAGQSNMEGQAVADLDGPDYNGREGDAHAPPTPPRPAPPPPPLLPAPAKAALARTLVAPSGGWAARDDVWVRYRREGKPLLAGPLTVGFSVYADAHHFGPELQFGHVLGDHLAGQVLLVKTAWG